MNLIEKLLEKGIFTHWDNFALCSILAAVARESRIDRRCTKTVANTAVFGGQMNNVTNSAPSLEEDLVSFCMSESAAEINNFVT